MPHRQFRLPDLGEGLTEAEIVRWLVDVGETVTVNQPLVEVETAKAVVEIPSPFAGVLVERHCEAGRELAVGAPLLTIDAPGDEPSAGALDGPPAASLPESRSGEAGDATTAPASAGPGSGGPGSAAGRPSMATGRTPMLVGYGPRSSEPERRRRRRQRDESANGGAPAASTAAAPATAASPARLGRAAAKPPVRKLARDLGVDLSLIVGTGPAGSISRADVESAAARGTAAAAVGLASAAPSAPPAPSAPLVPAAPPAPNGHKEPTRRVPGAIPDDASFDPATGAWRIPVTGIRRTMARAMAASVFTAPHATEFLSVDVTEAVAARERITALPDFAGVRVTPLLLVAKALITAVRRHPLINATWVDGAAGEDAEIRVRPEINLGIAVAGPRGLVVPNIPDAGSLDLPGLARALQSLTEAARADRLRPADLSGGTITITNIGVFGVDTGTPVLNPGEAAILALGAIRPTPWVHRGELAVRTVAQLALTFDHRVVDGELGSAVLADVGAMLADPVVALAWS
ncbi:pyruvate dehydrogenase E2 component (dihydrolipoamide acetyltransferase) [Parafrankia irregularis]|uniref:Dihydrolipoamide acetyltransferase component of pyruvate dehydrogenase complex n=1 Tax=Parafrankia irregularis TaxID=795642 RepID=A0A0S4QP48_9ACTN|nr:MULTISPECIES: dihydrolipoamide acetyltransferase family protein [Parafrankia]MBE3204274.1 2-oxo acid dehydrogenase subunit E2 [Parafrankia sp. CH37]CUU57245.1 pyruvate dehydrogenase E2 component (dihydrolipoamide acetyltransferase) [Parafrankia irregularis]